MDKKVVRFKKRDKDDWGKMKVCAELTINRRPAYTNNEISNLFRKRVMENSHSEEQVAKICGVDTKTVRYMLEGKYQYSYKMLKAISLYLNVPYNKLTEVLEDDNRFSCRACNNEEDTEELFDIINYIFNEMIRQKRLAE